MAVIFALLAILAQTPNHPGPATNNAVPIGDGTRWQTTVIPDCQGASGAIGYDAGTRAFFCNTIDAGVSPTESADTIPLPEGRIRGDSTIVAPTTLNGGSFFLRRRTSFSRIQIRNTNQNGSPTLAFAIYQASNGGSGVAAKLATVTGFSILVGPPGTTYDMAPTEGAVVLEEGIFYVLYGRDSGAGSITLRTYTTEPLALLNSSVNTALHPTTFTTTIAASSLPATFDPRHSPTGPATGTTTDVLPIIRLYTP